MMENSKSGLEARDQTGSATRTKSSRDYDQEASDGYEKPSTEVNSPQTSPQHEVPASNFKPEADLEKLPGRGRPGKESEYIGFRGEEENPNVGVPFQSPSSPTRTLKAKDFLYQNFEDSEVKRMYKFSLYGTSTWFYLVGADIMDKCYRVLKIDRTAPPGHLNLFEDDIVYNRRQMHQLLRTIDDGNKSTGGLKEKCSAWGLLGFIRFTDVYYMLLITKRAQVAMVGGHYIYQVEGTEMIPLVTGATSRFQKDRNAEETRHLTILNSMDLTRSFYFSYSYNVTRSLQQNIIYERTALSKGDTKPEPNFQDMFIWNQHLLQPAHDALNNVYDWCHPLIHGYIDQSSLDIFGKRVYITIIARRSRFFAGARFLKRGTNDLGYVANDVETEQIVSAALTTSFHAPGPRFYASPAYTSYVQHRGSIPLYWTQDNSGVSPKPDIDISLIDPFYSAAALHFDHLFERYGAPIYVINLIKARERTPRESKLLYEYKNAIDYLNQSLPSDKKILYEAFDMSRASKTRGQDVIGTLEQLAEKVLLRTGFFQNGDENYDIPLVQNGVARMNCIDCLDRTNAAQFVIGKRALGRQLHALGVISGNTVEYDSDCVEMFTHMFHGHGDAIAIQYGGSHLVNTMATYRKINQWQSSSRDMVESFKRYYHNSFLDSQRQEAYNLFLGNYVFIPGQPMLWELSSDYYLHHRHPRASLGISRRSYIGWYTPSFLQQRTLPRPLSLSESHSQIIEATANAHDDYWLEYYRPLALSSFLKIFAFRLASPRTGRDVRDGVHPTRKEDISPFVPRMKQIDHEHGKHGKKAPRKGVTIIDPFSETESRYEGVPDRRRKDRHIHIPHSNSPVKQSILRDPHFETHMGTLTPTYNVRIQSLGNSTSTSTGLSATLRPSCKLADTALASQWTLTQFYENSVNPSVSVAEEEEYVRYIDHPLNLPLVVDSEIPGPDDSSAMEYYEYLCMTEGAVQPARSFDEGAFDGPISDLPRLDTDAASIRSFASHNRPATSQSMNTPFSHALGHPYSQHTPLYPHKSNPFLTLPYQPQTTIGKFQVTEEDIEQFEEFLRTDDNPLDVAEDDGTKKRYKAYKQWLKGKSFFKQSKVDPEWQNQLPVR